MIFKNRQEAGILLAGNLSKYSTKPAVVIGLTKGGVAVALPIASKLNLPLNVLIIKKIPSPNDAELAIGALAPDGVFVTAQPGAVNANVDNTYLTEQIIRLSGQIKQLTHSYKPWIKPDIIKNKTVILVDDGIATGASLVAAINWCKLKEALNIVVAVPVAPPEIVIHLVMQAEEIIVLAEPADFVSVGNYYTDFAQITDKELVFLLKSRGNDIKY